MIPNSISCFSNSEWWIFINAQFLPKTLCVEIPREAPSNSDYPYRRQFATKVAIPNDVCFSFLLGNWEAKTLRASFFRLKIRERLWAITCTCIDTFFQNFPLVRYNSWERKKLLVSLQDVQKNGRRFSVFFFLYCEKSILNYRWNHV